MDQQQGQGNPPTPEQSTPIANTPPASNTSSPESPTPTSPPPSPTPPMGGIPPAVNQSTPPPTKKSNVMLLVIIVIVVVAILTGAGAYFWMHKSAPVKQIATPQPTMQPKPTTSAQVLPTISPVTQANVDQTLNNADTKMQQVVSQANSDLSNVNSINTSQDSTNGL